VPSNSKEIYDANNWKFGKSLYVMLTGLILKRCILDVSTPDFPGIQPSDGGFASLLLSPELHPHLRLDECMISVPKVNPGDTVFWHCDVVHSVEKEHTGSGDSAGKYFSAWS
jgi:hypothetical protein